MITIIHYLFYIYPTEAARYCRAVLRHRVLLSTWKMRHLKAIKRDSRFAFHECNTINSGNGLQGDVFWLVCDNIYTSTCR